MRTIFLSCVKKRKPTDTHFFGVIDCVHAQNISMLCVMSVVNTIFFILWVSFLLLYSKFIALNHCGICFAHIFKIFIIQLTSTLFVKNTCMFIRIKISIHESFEFSQHLKMNAKRQNLPEPKFDDSAEIIAFKTHLLVFLYRK